MLLIVVRIFFAFVCAGAIASFVSSSRAPEWINEHPLWAFFGLLALTQLVTLGDILLRRKRIDIVSSIYFGLLIGMLTSSLLLEALAPVTVGVTSVVEAAIRGLVTIVISYICITMIVQTRDNFRFVIPYVEFSRELKGGKPLVLDSSALIDGRIADVVETKIIDAQLIVPSFILKEVQDIADSSDKQRRARGRRGLDVLRKLQSSPGVDVQVKEVEEGEYRGMSVDQSLVRFTKSFGGRVMTNDFNLNKVASVQGVDVVNLNDVANSLKPRYIPGEMLKIKVIKEGESAGQGVGYLDDGTMVVCEQASHLIGQEIDVSVTSVLQSSAGRMIFGKHVDAEGGAKSQPSKSRAGATSRE